MPLQLSKVHLTEKISGTYNESRVIRTNHYIRVVAGNGPPLYIQGGEVFSEGGPLMEEKDIPDWFWVEVCKLSDSALKAVGYEMPLEKYNAVQNLLITSEPSPPVAAGRRRR
jgi:hypothetical protein